MGSRVLRTPQQALIEVLQHVPNRGRARKCARRLAKAIVRAQQTGMSAPGKFAPS